MNSNSHQSYIDQTVVWLERAVIGLNLCPFAKAEHVNQRIAYRVSEARTQEALLEDFALAAQWLQEQDAKQIETLLLIHPWVLEDFLDFNDFLELADDLLDDLEMIGELQVASFHPKYQFANTQENDVENYSNRSPFPTLHLLREDSVDKAVEAFPDAANIYQRNIDTLNELGLERYLAHLKGSD